MLYQSIGRDALPSGHSVTDTASLLPSARQVTPIGPHSALRPPLSAERLLPTPPLSCCTGFRCMYCPSDPTPTSSLSASKACTAHHTIHLCLQSTYLANQRLDRVQATWQLVPATQAGWHHALRALIKPASSQRELPPSSTLFSSDVSSLTSHSSSARHPILLCVPGLSFPLLPHKIPRIPSMLCTLIIRAPLPQTALCGC